MKTPRTSRQPLTRTPWCVLAAACLVVGCQPKGEPKVEPTPPAAVDLGAVAKRLLAPDYAVGALLIGKNGEIVAVDITGQTRPPCSLPEIPVTDAAAQAPSAEGKRAATADEPECAKVRNTTIANLQSPSIVRHTGSNCFLVGPIIHAGRAYYYQLPPGC